LALKPLKELPTVYSKLNVGQIAHDDAHACHDCDVVHDYVMPAVQLDGAVLVMDAHDADARRGGHLLTHDGCDDVNAPY
jgi:hypothetical protein